MRNTRDNEELTIEIIHFINLNNNNNNSNDLFNMEINMCQLHR